MLQGLLYIRSVKHAVARDNSEPFRVTFVFFRKKPTDSRTEAESRFLIQCKEHCRLIIFYTFS